MIVNWRVAGDVLAGGIYRIHSAGRHDGSLAGTGNRQTGFDDGQLRAYVGRA
jgi:hypothetical protein